MAQFVQVFIFVNNIKQGSIVFVNQNDSLLSRLPIRHLNQMGQTHIGASFPVLNSQSPFLLRKDEVKVGCQFFFVLVFASSQTKMNHRMFSPILFKAFNRQPFK